MEHPEKLPGGGEGGGGSAKGSQGQRGCSEGTAEMGGPAPGEGVGRPGRCWARARAGGRGRCSARPRALSPAWAGVSAGPELGGRRSPGNPAGPGSRAFGPLFGKARERLWVPGETP